MRKKIIILLSMIFIVCLFATTFIACNGESNEKGEFVYTLSENKDYYSVLRGSNSACRYN